MLHLLIAPISLINIVKLLPNSLSNIKATKYFVGLLSLLLNITLYGSINLILVFSASIKAPSINVISS